jgi:hypothetical protein
VQPVYSGPKYRCIYLFNFLRVLDAEREQSVNELWKKLKNDPTFYSWFHQQKPEALASMSYDALLAQYQKESPKIKKIAPKVYDLDSFEIGMERPLASAQAIAVAEFLGLSKNTKMSTYEQNIIEMRAGDTVKFGDKQFVLGEFLGAGNASHIYAIEGRDDAVIRIPYLSVFSQRQDLQQTFNNDNLSASREYLRQHVQFMKSINGMPCAKILEEDPLNRFVVASRVNGNKNAREFYFNLVKKAFPVEGNTQKDTPSYLKESIKYLLERDKGRDSLFYKLHTSTRDAKFDQEIRESLKLSEKYINQSMYPDSEFQYIYLRTRDKLYFLRMLENVANAEEKQMLKSLIKIEKDIMENKYKQQQNSFPLNLGFLTVCDFYNEGVFSGHDAVLRQMVWDGKTWVAVDADYLDVSVLSFEK